MPPGRGNQGDPKERLRLIEEIRAAETEAALLERTIAAARAPGANSLEAQERAELAARELLALVSVIRTEEEAGRRRLAELGATLGPVQNLPGH